MEVRRGRRPQDNVTHWIFKNPVPIKHSQKGGNMKGLMKHLALALTVAILFTSCAKQPTQELNNATAAIDAVVAEKGDVYAPDELKALNDDLQAANDEMTAQSKKFFKKYGKAKERLVKLVTDADA